MNYLVIRDLCQALAIAGHSIKPSQRKPTCMARPQEDSFREFPLIDSPLFSDHRLEGLFGDHLAVADQLHQQGYAVLDLGRDRMELLASSIKNDLRCHFEPEIAAWRARGAKYSPRLQDAWKRSHAVRELALLPEITSVLKTCWGRETFAFQTLNFPVGTQQELHSDAVHFHSEPAGFMCGVWVPLEDIHPDSGPLLYVPGTHRLPYLQAADVGVTQREGWTPTQEIFEPYWRTLVAEGDFPIERFTPHLGQILIWTANLIHGGSSVADSNQSRWSQVTHYFFEGCRHYTPMLSDWPEGPVAWRQPFDISQGCEHQLESDSLGQELLAIEALADSYGWSLQMINSLSISSIGLEIGLLEEAIASRESGAAAFSLALVEWALEAGFTSPWLQDNRARALVNLQRLQEACDLWQELSEPHHTAELQEAAREMLNHYANQRQLEAALLRGDLSLADQWLDALLEQGRCFGPIEWQPLIASLDHHLFIPLVLPLLEVRLNTHPSDGLFRLIDGLRLLLGDANLDQLLRVSQDQLLAFGWRSVSGEAVLVGRSSTGRWIQARSNCTDLCRPDVAKQLQLPALTDAGFLASICLEPGESLISIWLQGHQQQLEVRDLRGLHYLGVVDHLLQLCQAGLTPLERAPTIFESGIGAALQKLAVPLQSKQYWETMIHRSEHFGCVASAAEITVVIPLYRRWDFILGHVAGFCKDPWFVERRVRLLYVIDDPSIESALFDWCYGNLINENLDVTVVSLNKNYGFSLACNCGVHLSETNIIFLMNSDVFPTRENWLEPLVSCIRDAPESLVAPLLVTDEGQIQHAGMHCDFNKSGFLPRCLHSLKGLHCSQLDQLTTDMRPYQVEALSGAALMFEKTRFLGIGGFDPVFGRGDFEDLDLSLRWKKNFGAHLTLVPESRLVHLERQSFNSIENPLDEWRSLLNAWHAKKKLTI